MKSILFISRSIFIGVMAFFITAAHAQPIASNDGIAITLSCNSEVSLNEALTELISKYRMQIHFEPKDVEGYKVRIECKEYTEEQVLDLLLKDTELEWVKSGGIVVISKIFPDKPGIVTGKLIDRDTTEPLHGANVWINDGDRKYRDVTDSKGTFRIRIHRGRYNLDISCVNYEPTLVMDVEVKPDKTVELNIELYPRITVFDGVVAFTKTKSKNFDPIFPSPYVGSSAYKYRLLYDPSQVTAAHPQPIRYTSDGTGITLNFVSEISLNEALYDSLIKKYYIPISYLSEDVKGYKVRIECKEYTVEQVLDLLLKDTDLEWETNGGTVTISKISPNKPGIVTGKLVDQDTKEPIIGANVWIGRYGNVTDATGTFRILHIPGGRYNLNVSHPNYKLAKGPVEVKSGKTTEINNIELSMDPIVFAAETITPKGGPRGPGQSNHGLLKDKWQDMVNNEGRGVVTMPNPRAQYSPQTSSVQSFPSQTLNNHVSTPIPQTEYCVCDPVLSSLGTMPNIRAQFLSQDLPSQNLISQVPPPIRPDVIPNVIMIIQMPAGSRDVQYVGVYQGGSVTQAWQNRVQCYNPTQSFYSQSQGHNNSFTQPWQNQVQCYNPTQSFYSQSQAYNNAFTQTWQNRVQCYNPTQSFYSQSQVYNNSPLTVSQVYQPMSLNVYGRMAPVPLGPIPVNKW